MPVFILPCRLVVGSGRFGRKTNPDRPMLTPTFLNGNLEETIYMQQSEGFIILSQEQKVCKLNRSIYGLKQASRSWNIRFDTAIKSYGFDQIVDEPYVCKRIINNSVAFLVVYVDDILLIGNDISLLTNIKQWLAAQFQMKDLGEAQFVLDI
ncbi:gag/pol protein [Cucumis melo var. makuwa]|uniref:Gag/pol protein n=1 Tax=Cucumis melo var. makuwa TaxID=1194695 RepID=A0A5D3DZF7_CUCMM|nr:gag/pol protein [Cucumis melo var. makuwa]TYK28894.1 gag/pol protein [Cucumis melo var. makuwa]